MKKVGFFFTKHEAKNSEKYECKWKNNHLGAREEIDEIGKELEKIGALSVWISRTFPDLQSTTWLGKNSKFGKVA